ncbi:LysM peptidoglycan-binding domain-containing protein [Candidatus Bathyarchaeota archaeon]|nr:LysM peptidoglycan-binding domain-containing protein [Candidatus Bathyarchaeota archaeon]
MTMKLVHLRAGLAWLASTAYAQSSPFDPCPVGCEVAGPDPANWTHLHGRPAMMRCDEPMLFDTAIHTPIDDPRVHITFRTCTASQADTVRPMAYNPAPFTFGDPTARLRRREEQSAEAGCFPGIETRRGSTSAQLLIWDDDESAQVDEADDLRSAAERLHAWLEDDANCGQSIMFARSGKAIVGLYVGSEVHKPSAATLVQRFIDDSAGGDGVGRIAAQVCADKTPSTWSTGIFADLRGNISAAQDAVRSLYDAECLHGADREDLWEGVEMDLYRATDVAPAVRTMSGYEQKGNPVSKRSLSGPRLVARAECEAIQVASGDGCYSVAERCDITQDDLEKHNPASDFCDKLLVDQWVCCSEGELPDCEFHLLDHG